MLSALKKLFDTNEGQLAKAQKIVDQINALEPEIQQRTYAQMQQRVAEMKTALQPLVDAVPADQKASMRTIDKSKGLPAEELAIQKKLLEFMPEMYAMIREVYNREMGIRHFDVQLLAGVIAAWGQKLVEVKTGEGKTMILNLPVFLYSLVGRGAHLVTVNEYLIKRDGEYGGHIADKLGLTVGIVAPGGASYKYISADQVKSVKGEEAFKELEQLGKPKLANMKGINLIETSKRDAYNCDITFSVNSELGFDYLRDNMANDLTRLVQRELYFVAVDEADSILIDEARTPLIISGIPNKSDVDKYAKYAAAVRGLEENVDYTINHKDRAALLTEDGIKHAEKTLGVDNLWADYSAVHHLENALKAKALFLRDDQYIVRNGEVLIVDQFTGRVMPGRRFSEGIHQAIEAKEGVTIQEENKTFATITFQNFFRLYKIMCGGSGTIITEAEEFYKIYTLESVSIPTHRKLIREDKNDVIYRNQDAKFRAVVTEVKERHEKGQPVLIGTTSVEKSELVSKLLDELGVPHSVLNAKYHEREAQIVAKAGLKGAVTVATNMAGRGTDIPLDDESRAAGGLAVLGTERHEARRIDNQLRGRSGRQGDPGFTRFYVALDDQIMKVMGGEILERSVGKIMDDDMPIELGLISRQIETAQKRIEWANFDTRKNLVDYDDVLNKQREIFYSRRRRLLELTEKAQQANPDSDAVQELKSTLREMLAKELNYLIESHFAGERKLSDANTTELLNQILDVAPDVQIAHAFNIPATELVAQLKSELQARTADKVYEYLEAGFNHMLDHKVEEFGADFAMLFKFLMLEGMDSQWQEHLETISDIRTGIGLQGYAQRDPLVEYKNVAFKAFRGLIDRIESAFVRRVFKIARVEQLPLEQQQVITNENQITDILTGDREMGASLDAVVTDIAHSQRNLQQQLAAQGEKRQPIKSTQKVGRNDPCPCGSGKKYKNCHGKNS